MDKHRFFTETEIINAMFESHKWGINGIPEKEASELIYQHIKELKNARRK
ncbi:MAG: hypothetical protein R6U59_02385 [Eubacteriales bacterium]